MAEKDSCAQGRTAKLQKTEGNFCFAAPSILYIEICLFFLGGGEKQKGEQKFQGRTSNSDD